MHAKASTASVVAGVPVPGASAEIVSFRPPARPITERLREQASRVARAVVPPVIVIGLTLFVWQVLCSAPGAPLPSPSKVISDSWDFIADPFFDNGGIDKGAVRRISKSLAASALASASPPSVGIALGVLVGQSTWAMRGLDPIFQVLRTIPPLAWLPLSLAGFRDAQPSALFVIFITSIWPIIINTSVGVRNIPQDYRNVAAVIRLSWWEVFWKITLPATVPYIFTGLRIGVGLSWLAIVAAEMLIGGVGIGFFIWDAWNSSRISRHHRGAGLYRHCRLPARQADRHGRAFRLARRLGAVGAPPWTRPT